MTAVTLSTIHRPKMRKFSHPNWIIPKTTFFDIIAITSRDNGKFNELLTSTRDSLEIHRSGSVQCDCGKCPREKIAVVSYNDTFDFWACYLSRRHQRCIVRLLVRTCSKRNVVTPSALIQQHPVNGTNVPKTISKETNGTVGRHYGRLLRTSSAVFPHDLSRNRE